MAESKAKAPRGTVRRVLACVRPYRARLGLSVLMAAVFSVGELTLPIMAGRAIDLIVAPGSVDFAALAPILTRIAVVTAVCAAAQWVMNALGNAVTFGVVRDVRKQAFDRILRVPVKYVDAHPHGDVVSRIVTDADQFADGLLLGFNKCFCGVISIVGTLVFMLVINWKIALVVALLTPLSLFAARTISRRSYRAFQAQSTLRGEQTGLIDETLENIKTVKAFSREAARLAAFDDLNGRLSKASLRATFLSSLTNPTTRFVNSVVYAAVALCGSAAIVSGHFAVGGAAFTVGALSGFLAYANRYTKPFNEISGVFAELQNALACAARLFELLDAAEETPDGADARVLTDPAGGVSFHDAAFSYDPARPFIRDLSLDVKPGQRVAIVGPTGCGKTTLINLLMRFYDVTGGSVAVDGTDVRDITRGSLRRSFGMVLQETWLMHGTVAENIAYARPDASREEIVAAAKKAHAHSFIRRLPDGYDTVVGADGGSLSQGQRQQLCAARLFLAQPRMLILDEATSSIDTRTEQQIQAAFTRLMDGRTAFIVAHRLSTIRHADVILVMRDGQIVETGDHETLLARGGFYAELHQAQFGAVST